VVNVVRYRGQLLVCATGCCCGRTDEGYPSVPTQLYHDEWERRGLRNVVHLTIGGCLGPCALANVVLLLFDGQALWFHSINSEALVRELYDHIGAMLKADGPRPAPAALARYQFTASAWQPAP
jgi:cobaltochelatase CobN